MQRRAQATEKRCNSGDATGCVELADLLEYGEGIDKDLSRAATLRERACEQHQGKACFDVATQYSLGDGVTSSDGKARDLYRRACDLEYSFGCLDLARELQDPELYQRAFDLDRARCEAGGLDGCVAARRSKVGGVTGSVSPEAWQGALAATEKQCSAGDVEQCFYYWQQLGYATEPGAPDKERAAIYRQRACDLGHAYSCLSIGQDYVATSDTPDPERAAQFHRRACDLGESNACSYLIGTESDPRAATELLHRSCLLGHHHNCFAALEIYAGANGAAPDPARAEEVAASLCRMGFAEGCVHNARVAEREKNTARALELRRRACMFNDAASCALGERD